jgi:hypothetical protein
MFDLDNDAIAATIGIAICGDGIRVTPHPFNEFGIESIEVFFGAANLQPATSELRSDHAIRSERCPLYCLRSEGISSDSAFICACNV